MHLVAAKQRQRVNSVIYTSLNKQGALRDQAKIQIRAVKKTIIFRIKFYRM